MAICVRYTFPRIADKDDDLASCERSWRAQYRAPGLQDVGYQSLLPAWRTSRSFSQGRVGYGLLLYGPLLGAVPHRHFLRLRRRRRAVPQRSEISDQRCPILGLA